MIYRFWKTTDGDCLIEVTDSVFIQGTKAYRTGYHPVYESDDGRHLLLSHIHGWGFVPFQEYDINELTELGTIEVNDLTLTDNDIDVLNRCIDKEEFDYAMLYYSDYQSVMHNAVESREFHALRNNLVNAHRDLKTWLKLQGVEVE